MSTMAIVCPGCGANLKATAPLEAGKRLKCPRCQEKFSEPAPTTRGRAFGPRAALGGLVLACVAGVSWAAIDRIGSHRSEGTPRAMLSPRPMAVAESPRDEAESDDTSIVAVLKPEPGPRIKPDPLAAIKALDWSVRPVATGAERLAKGRDLFLREWLADDPRSHGGDGLGPMFNDSSCVACHNLGGPGGAGPVGKNVEILSASNRQTGGMMGSAAGPQQCATPAGEGSPTRMSRAELAELTKLHPGFRDSSSVVLHRFGTDPDYDPWRDGILAVVDRGANIDEPRMMGMMGSGSAAMMGMGLPSSSNREAPQEITRLRMQVAGVRQVARQARGRSLGRISVGRSERNTPPLFGAGLIDSIPESAIATASAVAHRDFPEIKGRANILPDGKIGRFGWKAQKAALDDFVLTACAVELGLEVPEHHQGGVPQDASYKGPGLDMDGAECDALVAFVRDLPAPESRPSSAEIRTVEAGGEVFRNVGCASCHLPKLGDVTGLYSDLLLHDMGDDLGDTGSYGVFSPGSPRSPGNETAAQQGASRREWRTPPLWGLRDSGPYMHDGRAETIDQAIALHGGLGEASARRYFDRTSRERGQLHAFLRSLVAPGALARAEN